MLNLNISQHYNVTVVEEHVREISCIFLIQFYSITVALFGFYPKEVALCDEAPELAWLRICMTGIFSPVHYLRYRLSKTLLFSMKMHVFPPSITDRLSLILLCGPVKGSYLQYSTSNFSRRSFTYTEECHIWWHMRLLGLMWRSKTRTEDHYSTRHSACTCSNFASQNSGPFRLWGLIDWIIISCDSGV
jgi:hypothetical protein